jgi:hypothetical protein
MISGGAGIERQPNRSDSVALIESEIAALRQRLTAARQREHAASLEATKLYVEAKQALEADAAPASVEARLRASGLFDPELYVSLHPDLPRDPDKAWQHFVQHGMSERRPFTSPEIVARCLARLDRDLTIERLRFVAAAENAVSDVGDGGAAALLRKGRVRIGVFCSSLGNFFMREIADMLAWGLQAEGIEAIQRDETSDKGELFDLRVFVAPHEFFWLGEDREWTAVAGAANSVLYNVEQPQTEWFCRAAPLLLQAPLVLDISFHTAMILRRAGCEVVHFMPGHLPTARYAQPCVDVSGIPLVKGYAFARQPYDWLDDNRLEARPIDILFIGARAPRRDKALVRLQDLTDQHRFMCVYWSPSVPFTGQSDAAAEQSWSLSQRAKIVLNLHRDWIGYFEWPRMVMRGFWQGACVVSDPGLSNPIFEPGVHYLEENLRHIGELIRWLLETDEGRGKLDRTRMAGYERARSLGSMRVALMPVLESFATLLRL